MEKSEVGKSGDGFIDRSKVRILLCDNDEKSSRQVLTLLRDCSYQVTSVRSPRQVIDALNAEGPDIDIILSEVDLPMVKGLKMLKYIMRDRELRRIPVIMMSAQDEVSVVVKCLKFGAADYLVKPLRTNELLNLWTHMWRRRRMLGLAEKNILNYDLDLVASDPSDANTNSTTLFSDDTDDKSRKSTNTETCVSTHQEGETNVIPAAVPLEIVNGTPEQCLTDVPEMTGQDLFFPKKSELKIGESSAFFTYVKSRMHKINNQGSSSVHEMSPAYVKNTEKLTVLSDPVGTEIQRHDKRESMENRAQRDDYLSSNSFPDSFSLERTCTSATSLNVSQQQNSKEEFSQAHMHLRNDSSIDVTGCYAHTASYPFYMSGVINQAAMSSAPAPIYHKNLADMHNHSNSAMLPQYNHIPQCPPHVPGIISYPYYPFMCLQSGQISQIPTPHSWPSHGNATSNKGKLNKVDRREAALMKFRQKRKERCFDKKIRYVNRKKLAERRPRVRGQFVRKVNGVNVDLNGQPASIEDDQEEEEDSDEDDQTASADLSPEDDASLCN